MVVLGTALSKGSLAAWKVYRTQDLTYHCIVPLFLAA